MTDDKNRGMPFCLQNLSLPVIGAPLFIAGGPDLVIAQCKAGLVGAFPALNARPAPVLSEWLTYIETELAQYKETHPADTLGPLAVNQIVHASNSRLEVDTEVCIAHQVPIIITSLRVPPDFMLRAIHQYGGIVLHDVTTVRHAQKALEAGVDGLVLVAAGAGGHAGTLSPFALVGEVRRFFDGPLALAGSIMTGDAILAAQVMGADFAYLGSRWLATQEAQIEEDYRKMLITSNAADITYTSYFTGIPGNYLNQSILNAGFDLEKIRQAEFSFSSLNFDIADQKMKVWRDIWSAGHGVGLLTDAPAASEVIERLKLEYNAAKKRAAILIRES